MPHAYYGPDSLPAGDPAAAKSWYFSGLSGLNRFWMQSILAVLGVSHAKRIYSWVPHPWFSLIDHTKGIEFINSLRLSRVKSDIVIGGTSELDIALMQYAPEDIYNCVFGSKIFADYRSTYITLIGETVITVELDALCTRIVEDIFRDLDPQLQIPAADLEALLDTPSTISLALEQNPAKASELRRSFQLHFAPRDC